MVVQAAGSKQACAELQQQLQEQTEAHNREVSDLTRMTTKVRDLEFDLGNMQQSLQVILLTLGMYIAVFSHLCVLLRVHPCSFLVLLQSFQHSTFFRCSILC